MGQMQKRVDLRDIAEILRGNGFEVKEAGENVLETSVGGIHYYVSELATEDLSIIWVRAHFKFDKPNEIELLRKANRWNQEFLFGHATVDGADTMLFDYHFSSTEVSKEHVLTVLAFWSIELTKFGMGVFK